MMSRSYSQNVEDITKISRNPWYTGIWIKPTQLRAWVRKHGDKGLIVAACYLAATHLWTKRKAMLCLLLVSTVTVSVFLHSNSQQSAEQINTGLIARQQSDLPNIDYALLNAAQSGNLAQVEAAINQKANVNARNAQGETALHLVAAIQPDSKNEHDIAHAAKALIINGANIDPTDHNGWTPLMDASYHAAYHGHTTIVGLLLAEGAKINAISKDGTTALMLAAERKPDILKVLLDKKASVDIRDKYDHTALTIAEWANNPTSIGYLKAAGATN
jgi:hypothetical protein